MPRLALFLFDRLRAILDGASLSHFRSARAQGLLAYLALESRRAHTREALATLFWPDEADEVSKQNLRQALYQLRQLLGESTSTFLLVTRNTVQFNPDSSYSLDVADFLAHLQKHELEAAVELYQGDLLSELAIDSEPFEEWLLLARERLHILALDALSQLAQRALDQSDFDTAQAYARRQLALESWREAAHRQLMLALAASGDRSAALAQYEACHRILANELGVEPDDETQKLIENIRRGALPGRRNWHQRSSQTPQAQMRNRQDWGEVPDPLYFYGRKPEFTQIAQWLVTDQSRLVAIVGMGGIGKTSLAAKVARELADQFQVVIWRSLVNAPPLADILHAWARFLSNQQLTDWPDHLDAQLVRVFEYLRSTRCLLVLDNVESIMQGGDRAGYYRPGYQDYGQLFRRMGESAHQSVLLLTSREQPNELPHLEAGTPRVRILPLSGLDTTVASELLANRGLVGKDESTAALVTRYSGNPLALGLVADTIHDLFDSDIDAFLGDETLIYDDIRDVLDQQFGRLSRLERDILVCLSVEREPIAESALWESLARTTSKRSFLEALRSLQRRSLLERFDKAIGLQNVVTEYLTDFLVTEVCREYETETPRFLHTHALIRASAKEYIRQSQQRMLLEPIGERLTRSLGRARFEDRSKRLIGQSRSDSALQSGFVAGNILNLLLHLGINVTGYDFSRLSVWQAYLRGAELPGVDFSHADLSASVFTDYVGAVTSVALSPHGQLLAAGADNGAIYLWQLANRQLVGVCQGHRVHVWSLAFSPDGRHLVSASNDQTARIWDVKTWQPVHILSGHAGGVTSVAFSPDGTAVASGSADQTVRVWNASTGQLIHVLAQHDAMVAAVAYSPDGATLASGSYDHTVRLWDWRHEEVLYILHGHTQPVRVVAYSPRPVAWGQAMHTLLVSGSFDQTLRVWDAQSGEPLANLSGHTAPVLSAAFSADGTLLMSGSDDQTVRVWDMRDLGPRPPDRPAGNGQTLRVLQGHYGAVNALAVDPQPTGGQVLLVSGSHDKTVRLWDVGSGHTLTILRGHSKWLQAIVFTPDGRLLVGGSDGQNIRVWDGHSGRVLCTLRGHASLTEKITFRGDGAYLASAGWDKTARIWDVERSQMLHVLQGHTEPVAVAAFGRDSRGRGLIASGSLDHTVRMWDEETGHALASWHGHSDRVVAFAFHPNGSILASGGWDRTIGLWNTHNGELVCFLEGHETPIECVAFHPSGELLASGSWDGSVRMWNVCTVCPVHTLQAHTSGLEMVAFSPDGTLLASSACDNTVCLWDARRGRLLHRLQGHTSWVRCVAFSPDGALLASGSDDGTVKLWDATPAGAGRCLQTIAMEDPYTGMNISGATGITSAQKMALKALGAVER